VQNLENVYTINSANAIVAAPIDLTQGQVYLELFGTGVRDAAGVTATVGGFSVPVLSSGAQGGYAGLDQINIGPMPRSLQGQGQVNIVLAASGIAANTVNVTFQ
jgi:uncharacterized protein (TIGR03437 family)